MGGFLFQVKSSVDCLTFVLDTISLPKHIDVILEGLPQDYQPIIYVIESKFKPLPIEEVEALLEHKSRLQKHQ